MRSNQITHEDLGLGFFALMAKALSRSAQETGKAAAPASATTAELEPRRGLLDRLDAWFWEQDQRAREAYLGTAKDVYELEARIRDLERGVDCRFH